MGNHTRLLASYDLQQLVYTFAVILAVAAIFMGILMVRAGVSGRRRVVIAGPNGVVGGMLAAFGTALILLVGMATVGPWREHAPRAFPIHIIDLQAPISEAERDALRRPGS